MELVLAGGGYSEIAALMAQTIARPVVILDRFRRVLGHSSEATGLLDLFESDFSGDLYLKETVRPAGEAELGWGNGFVLTPARSFGGRV